MAPYCKQSNDKMLRDNFNCRVERLKALLFPGVPKAPQNKVLYRAVDFLTGKPVELIKTPSSSSSSPTRKEIKNDREQGRRDEEHSAMDALKNWIRENELGTEAQKRKLEKSQTLDIAIEQVRRKLHAQQLERERLEMELIERQCMEAQRFERLPHPFSIAALLAPPKPMAIVVEQEEEEEEINVVD